MRVTVQHGLKVPGDQQFSSRQHSIAVDLDVPPEIASDKVRLRDYLESVGVSVRRQVEEALGQQQSGHEARAPISDQHERHDRRNGSQPPRSRSRNGTQHNGNGRNGSAGTHAASEKQRRFIRSLGQQARFTPGQLDAYCEENFACGLQGLSKRDASMCIEFLREEAA